MPLFNADEREPLARLSPLGQPQLWPPETNQTRGWSCTNCSHCLTNNWGVAAKDSLKSCGPPRKGKPMLLSMELLTMKGTLSEVAHTPNFDPWPVSGWVPNEIHIRKLHYLLSSGAPSPSNLDRAKWDCSRMKDADPVDCRPESAR